MRLILTIFALSILFSCSKEENSQKPNDDSEKKSVKSKFKKPNSQPAPEREIINLIQDPMTFEAVAKINKEIPVLEIITGKDWTQKDYEGLVEFELLDTIRFENSSLEGISLDFLLKMRKLKEVSISDNQANLVKSLSEKRPNIKIIKK